MGCAGRRSRPAGTTKRENDQRRTEQHHHDHVICDRCGRIVEFSDDDLERLQEDIATRLGFVLARHRLELYGICRECREGGRPSATVDRVAMPSRR